ncbi:MAG: TonB-dependent receptor [Sphingomonas sp.]|nr:TonB-dependent receptor [Sphingomonas sp.]
MHLIRLTAAAVTAATPFLATAARADPAPAAEPASADAAETPEGTEDAGTAAKAHAERDDEKIVITGVRQSTPDVLGSVITLDKEELAHDLKTSLGDTLADMPGVSASSFGPTASRPIVRGESGERVRVLVDGIGSLDLSSSDPDHAVAINPLTAERIEVIHGPSALLYAGSAIGGVVNVVDNRIPRAVPSDGLSGDVLANYGTAANERSANASINAALGSKFVAHGDGSYSKYDDLRIGGHLLTPRLRDIARASGDPEIQALADLKGHLPNSAGRVDDIAGGLAFIDGAINIGASISHHDAKYQVPVRYSLDPTVVDERPTIDAHQDRADVRAAVPIGGFFKAASFRGGLSRYRHAELEPNGAVGSRFYSNGGEGRFELEQNDRRGWGGLSGIAYLSQDARIKGSEKYLPDSVSRSTGLFTLQTYVAGPLHAEAALRVDFGRLHADRDPVIAAEPDGDPRVGNVALNRGFIPVSASIGANYDVGGDLRLGLSLSHSERSPSIDELFSKGPHGGSQQFLVGNPDLGIEKSNGIELTIGRARGPLKIQGSLYYSRYTNFIFESPTGEVANGLPLYEYLEGKANYYGFELESEMKFGQALGILWGGELTTDAVRARIKHYGNAPEIPPFRVLAGLTGSRGEVDGRMEVERVSGQHRTAPEETATPGYTMVNASLDWHPFAGDRQLTLSLTGNNLFDVNARRHSSDLKDYAPLAGRDIRLTARFSF